MGRRRNLGEQSSGIEAPILLSPPRAAPPRSKISHGAPAFQESTPKGDDEVKRKPTKIERMYAEFGIEMPADLAALYEAQREKRRARQRIYRRFGPVLSLTRAAAKLSREVKALREKSSGGA